MDLRSYRKQHQLTLEDMGKALGVTGVTVHRWETGKARPTLNAIEKIQEATSGQVTAADFLRRVEQPAAQAEAA